MLSYAALEACGTSFVTYSVGHLRLGLNLRVSGTIAISTDAI